MGITDKKTGIFEKTSDIFGMPGDLAAGVFRITSTGGRKVMIENHRGILEYGDKTIKVNCGRTIVRIEGNELQVKSISASDMLITGEIEQICFER